MQTTPFSDLLGSHLYCVWNKFVLLKAPHDRVKKKKGGNFRLDWEKPIYFMIVLNCLCKILLGMSVWEVWYQAFP